MVKIVEAFRFGVENPPVWLVWTGREWEECTALGEQVWCGEVVNVVEKGQWNQSLRHRGPVRR
jgi:hypothetical protein